MKKQHASAQGAVQNCMECYVTLLDSHMVTSSLSCSICLCICQCAFDKVDVENLTLDDNCMYIVYPIECTHRMIYHRLTENILT